MDEIVVSIIVATYNHEKYIETALRSILSQKTEYRFEILVGDDASKDRSPEIIAKIAAAYPDIVISVLRTENLGATKNGFDLLCRARGRYIASCDGDDCWCDGNRLQEQVEFLENHQEYSAVCGRVRLIDDEGNPLPQNVMGRSSFFLYEKDFFTLKEFEQWLMPGHNSALLQRFDRDRMERSKELLLAHPTVGDRTSLLYSLLQGPVYCTQNVVSCYRILNHKNHFMAQYVKQNLRDQDVRMMSSIESFVKREYNISINLEPIKKDRFAAAVNIWMKNNTKRNRQVLWNIWSESDQKLTYAWIFAKTFVLKLYYWNVLHEDRRIRI